MYSILKDRTSDDRWKLPARPVEPDPASRLFDPNNPDKAPRPPDDPAAAKLVVAAYQPFGLHAWKHRGVGPIENASWRPALPLEANGELLFSRDSAIRYALLHSREYQQQVEQLYLIALVLTLNRFEFEVQWSGGNQTFFQHFGAGATESNQLSTNSTLGLSRSLASGGQIVANFANSLVWEFAGPNVNMATSSLLVTMTQPLLRGAFATVRTELLTLAERQVLYQVRDFARFRRGFYVDVVAGGGGFLGLLLQVQSIRNLESNLQSLERNLREHEELNRANRVAPIQVDQVYQQYQQGRLRVLSARAALQTSLDSFELQLGLPPDLPARIDDTLLKRFELNDPRLDDVSQRNDALFLALLQPDMAPPPAELTKSLRQLMAQQQELAAILDNVQQEWQRWQLRLQEQARRPEAQRDADARGAERSQQARANQLRKVLDDLHSSLAEDRTEAQQALDELAPATADKVWKKVRSLVGKDFRTVLTDIFVTQTTIRVFLIELEPLDLSEDAALRIALENRLDLMNQRAQVSDAWRNVEFAADALEAQLDIRYEMDLRTDPQHDGILRFDASASRHRVGLVFDSPLNRRRERNVYRAAQLNYQQARRRYMATEDGIRAQVRRDVRDLELSRLQFDISRQQLVAAARQVEQAQFNLQNTDEADSSVTQDLLGALQTLLDAKNSLIANWVSFETARMNLFRDLDIMTIDAIGAWTNEHAKPCLPADAPESVELLADPADPGAAPAPAAAAAR